MALFTIGDLHLSFACKKPMDVFSGWENYVEKLEKNWVCRVKPEDTVVVAGDISWAMNLEQALADFQFINRLPGTKIVLKGNHDYYWSTMKKMQDFLQHHGLDSIHLLHNNAYYSENYRICGTRGWMLEHENDFNKKIILREQSRLCASLNAPPVVLQAAPAGSEHCEDSLAQLPPIVFFHYPPIYNQIGISELIEVLQHNGVKRCYYGHIHGKAGRYAPKGTIDGIYYELVSCDYTEFYPVRIG